MSPYTIDPSLLMSSLVGSSLGGSPFIGSSDLTPPLGQPLGARVARRMVAICMFCGASRLPARTSDGGERWEPLPPSVRDEIRRGAVDIAVSHGLCPRCARQHYPEFFD